MTIWDQVLARVETKVNRHSFSTWFRRTTFVADDGTRVTIRVPDTVFRDWLLKHYSGFTPQEIASLVIALIPRLSMSSTERMNALDAAPDGPEP